MPAVPEVDERREHQRVEPRGATAETVLSGQTLTFGIDNLSEGGALIAGRIAGELHSRVELRIRLPGAPPIPMPARLLRYVPRGGQDYTAVMFLAPSDALTHWISDVVLEGLRSAFPAPASEG